MKVLFLTLYPELAASPRYRVHQYLPALEAAGFTCRVACAVSDARWLRSRESNGRGHALRYHLQSANRRWLQLRGLRLYDRIFVQKGVTAAPVLGLTRRLIKNADRVIYDLDDAVHLFPPDQLPAPLRWLEPIEPEGSLLMREARVTLAGNHWLEEQARERGGRPVYFPTVVDTRRFAPRMKPDQAYRLGWMGSPSTVTHLETLGPLLRDVPDVELLVVGAGDRPLAFNCEHRAWSLESEVGLLSRISVGLMPLPHGEWSRGKCGLKALLYMAMGKPVIASRYGAATEIIEDGVTGLLCDSDEEWRAAIERLRDPAERHRMGDAARAHVEAHYSLGLWAPRMASLLRNLP